MAKPVSLLKRWQQARQFALLYRALSDTASGSSRQLLFLELARDADQRAAQLAQQGTNAGITLPDRYSPSRLTRCLLWCLQSLGQPPVIPLLRWMGLQGLHLDDAPPAAPLPVAVVNTPFSIYSGVQRVAIQAMHDGLFAMTLLFLVLAGAQSEYGIILMAGIGGLLCCAVTEAIGEAWLMRRRCNAYVRQTRIARGLERDITPVAKVLATLYESRGMTADVAENWALQLTTDPELGDERNADTTTAIHPSTLAHPRHAALTAFFACVMAGIVPLTPYFFTPTRHPLLIALSL